jgi:hypothetical protein
MPELHALYSYVQTPDVLPAELFQKLSTTLTVMENALKDNLSPCLQNF